MKFCKKSVLFINNVVALSVYAVELFSLQPVALFSLQPVALSKILSIIPT